VGSLNGRLGQKENLSSIHARHELNDEAFGYLKRVIVTPAVYPRFGESLHFDDSEHWAEITLRQHRFAGHRNALF